MDHGGSHRGRQTPHERNRNRARATDQSAACQYLPALCARRMVRGRGEAPLEGGSARDPVCRRRHLVFSAQGGRGKSVECLIEAVCEIRFDTAPGENAADRVRAGCGEECEATGEETPDLRFSRLHPHLCPPPEGEVHSQREDDRQTAPQGAEGDRRLVQAAPARPCGRATENPERQTPRPLPVLRTPDELPKYLAVLSQGPTYLAGVAEPPHTRAKADVGTVCRNPTQASIVATPDHASLGGRRESRLRNPLRKICTAGS